MIIRADTCTQFFLTLYGFIWIYSDILLELYTNFIGIIHSLLYWYCDTGYCDNDSSFVANVLSKHKLLRGKQALSMGRAGLTVWTTSCVYCP